MLIDIINTVDTLKRLTEGRIGQDRSQTPLRCPWDPPIRGTPGHPPQPSPQPILLCSLHSLPFPRLTPHAEQARQVQSSCTRRGNLSTDPPIHAAQDHAFPSKRPPGPGQQKPPRTMHFPLSSPQGNRSLPSGVKLPVFPSSFLCPVHTQLPFSACLSSKRSPVSPLPGANWAHTRTMQATPKPSLGHLQQRLLRQSPRGRGAPQFLRPFWPQQADFNPEIPKSPYSFSTAAGAAALSEASTVSFYQLICPEHKNRLRSLTPRTAAARGEGLTECWEGRAPKGLWRLRTGQTRGPRQGQAPCVPSGQNWRLKSCEQQATSRRKREKALKLRTLKP